MKGDKYNVKSVYTYGAPRTLGNRAMRDKVFASLGSSIYRFEYGLDLITKLAAPMYEHERWGQRFWFDLKENQFKLYPEVKDRWMAALPTEFNATPLDSAAVKKEKELKKRMYSGFLPDGQDAGHHNPPYYVAATYQNLPSTERSKLPPPIDPFPYNYTAVANSK